MSNVHDIYPDDRIILREVGLRDGLQLVKTFPSTAAKRKWIAARIRCRRAAFRGRLVPVGKNLSAIRRCAGDRRHDRRAARRAWHRAGAERARRRCGAGLRRCRNRHGGLGHRRTQPRQRQPLARAGHRQRPQALRIARHECAQADRFGGDFHGARMFDRGAGRSEGSDPALGEMLRGRRRRRRGRRHRRLCRPESRSAN